MDPKARRCVPSADLDHPAPGVRKAAGDVSRTTLGSLGLKVGEPFGYWFDFGDDWWHHVTVLAIDEHAPPGNYPKVTNRVAQSPPRLTPQVGDTLIATGT